MLSEFPNVRQEPHGFRRLFCDEEFDLYAWYPERQGPLLGFQLVYFSGGEQKALTWTQNEGYRHNLVDGWDSSRFNKTPLLVPDGTFAPQAILEQLIPRMETVDPLVRTLVLNQIRNFPRQEPS